MGVSFRMKIRDLKMLITRCGLLYSLLLLPTLILRWSCLSDAQLSHWIEVAWSAGFWELPRLGHQGSKLLADILVLVVVASTGWWFYQGARIAGQLGNEDADEAEQLIFRGALWCSFILLAVIPFDSNDLYGYINRGAQQTVFQSNPYLTTVSQLPHWQHYSLFHSHWIDNPCPYGFLFAWLAKWMVILADNRFVLAFLHFKGLNALAFVGTVKLIQILGKQLHWNKPWLPAYLFGLNPLMLLHTVANGHNDILLVFFLLAAFIMVTRPKWAWLTMPCLMLSILIKYASILALPLFLLYWIRNQQWKTMVISMLAAGLVTAVLAWPYLPEGQSWRWGELLGNAGAPHHSLVSNSRWLIYYALSPFTSHAKAWAQDAMQLTKWLLMLGFCLFYARLCWQFWRQDMDFKQLLRATALALTVFIVFASAKFHAWYLLMCVPLLVLLAPQDWLYRFGLLLSLFQLAAFSGFKNLHILNWLTLTGLPFWRSLEKSPKT